MLVLSRLYRAQEGVNVEAWWILSAVSDTEIDTKRRYSTLSSEESL